MEDILFGMEEGFDFIAASFVRSAADVRELRKLLESRKSRIRIIAKIENQEGINNLTEILAAADGIMVARGDMGVEIDFTEIPAIQKNMIAQCVAAGKPVITATQMLDSMIENPGPPVPRSPTWPTPSTTAPAPSCSPARRRRAGTRWRRCRPWTPSPGKLNPTQTMPDCWGCGAATV